MRVPDPDRRRTPTSVRIVQRVLVAVVIVGGGGFLVWDAFQAQRETRERHEAVEARIDAALPPDRGVAPAPQPWELPEDLVLDVTTRPASEGVAAQVLIQVGEGRRWVLPLPPADEEGATFEAWLTEHADPALERIHAHVATLVAGRGVEVATIRTPRVPGGPGAPPALVLRLLAMLQAVGVHDVAFDAEGSPGRRMTRRSQRRDRPGATPVPTRPCVEAPRLGERRGASGGGALVSASRAPARRRCPRRCRRARGPAGSTLGSARPARTHRRRRCRRWPRSRSRPSGPVRRGRWLARTS